ncbi:MAG: hypothetical protein JKX68_00640, partial [Flavobacteriales bacterium]|nr:hypothetical protein [Flavobacteriales bacterium]
MKLITTLIALPIITLIFIGGNLFSQSVSDLNNNPELKNERGMYSSVFLKENGDKEAIYSASPVHYKKNNKWELINTNIISTNDGYKNEQNVIQSFFPNNITSAGKIKLLINGLDEIKILAEKKLVLYNDQTNLQLLDINSTNSTAKIDNNSIIYTNIYPGISDEYTISNGKIKNDVILNSIPNLLNNVSNGYFGFQEVLELPSGWKIKPLDKTVGTLTSSPLIIFNDNGEHVLTIPEPIFFDKNGLESDGANMVQGKYLLKQDNNRWTLSTLVPVDWLKDINTKYPISIDPTVVLAGADGGWMSTVTLVNNPAFAFIGVCCGNAQHRAWVKFNTTSIPDNSCVTNVELEVFVNGVGGAAGELVHANDITGAPGPYGGVNAAVLTDMANGLYTSFILGAAGTYGYYDLGVNADALLQAQLPVNWFQVALIFDNEPSTNWKRLTATACNLRVTYNSCCPPIPAIPTITGPASVCAGDAVTYTVPAQAGAATYTWIVPAGATITGGQGTTSLNVTWNTTPGGNICVDWTDACPVTSPQTCLTVTVNPVPTVTVPANATYCAGDAVPIGSFTSMPAGATFAWSNSNTAIGLAASGTGNAPAFTATNTTGNPITGTITVTPTLAGCVGTPVTYTITVNPVPTVTVPANATYCAGDAVPIGSF